MSIQRIIVGVDGSPGASTALEWAADECRARGCTLLVVHALDARDGRVVADPSFGGWDEFAEKLLTAHAAAASRRQPGVAVTTLLSLDPPADALIDLSSEAEMVVVGTRGSNGFTSTMLGSVSHRTAVHAHSPVAVVPQRLSPPRAGVLGPVVVGVSGGYAGRLALEFARHEAEVRGAPLQTVQADDDPAEALLAAAQAAQLLVVGCHHSEDQWSTRLGPVPASVLHQAPCPVIVVGAVHTGAGDRAVAAARVAAAHLGP
jgi:nucleotide-binding universal stress UspA family protein